jgi:hypothetical protein
MNTALLTIDVECYAGHEEEETPRCFFMDDKSIEIYEVIVRWLTPEYRYFKALLAQASGKNFAATIALGGSESICYARPDPTRGSGHCFTMTLRRVAMPCSFPSQATEIRPALRLSATKNLRSTLFRFQDFQRMLAIL